MFPRHGHTRGMDHVRLDATRRKPARQPEAVAAGFDRLIPPAMQQGKQPFGARLQLLARLTLNAGKPTANQPARLAQLDDGNDRAIVVQGDQGPAQVVRLGHRGTPSVRLQRRSCHVLAARPIASIGPATERLPSGASFGFRARLHQLGETLIPRATKGFNPVSSSGESSELPYAPLARPDLVERRCKGVGFGDLIGSGAAREEAVVGETPNLAARLQAPAEPDAVVIAEAAGGGGAQR